MGNSFRLAGLLRFRQAQEDQAAAALARANARRREHADRVGEVRDALSGAPSDPASAAALRASAAARSSARSMLLELQGHSESLTEDVAVAQRAVAVAKKRAASLEKLSEKHVVEQQRLLLHSEQVFLDELSSSRGSATSSAQGAGSGQP